MPRAATPKASSKNNGDLASRMAYTVILLGIAASQHRSSTKRTNSVTFESETSLLINRGGHNTQCKQTPTGGLELNSIMPFSCPEEEVQNHAGA